LGIYFFEYLHQRRHGFKPCRHLKYRKITNFTAICLGQMKGEAVFVIRYSLIRYSLLVQTNQRINESTNQRINE
jgi:hypothetical protein